MARRLGASLILLLLEQEAERSGRPELAVTRAALDNWVRRGRITRTAAGYDPDEVIQYLENRSQADASRARYSVDQRKRSDVAACRDD